MNISGVAFDEVGANRGGAVTVVPMLESIVESVMLHHDYFFVVLLIFGLYLMLQFHWTNAVRWLAKNYRPLASRSQSGGLRHRKVLLLEQKNTFLNMSWSG
jgi:hypothetical protein